MRARRKYQAEVPKPGSSYCRRSCGFELRPCITRHRRSTIRASARRLASSPLEVCLHEPVEVPVDHGLHIAGFVARSFVLHELVRRERVGADLTPERDVALVARQRLHLLALLLACPLREPGREDLHRLGLVLGLRTLVL